MLAGERVLALGCGLVGEGGGKSPMVWEGVLLDEFI